jgi:hypothetical protein
MEVVVDMEEEDRPDRFSKLSLGFSVQIFWASL